MDEEDICWLAQANVCRCCLSASGNSDLTTTYFSKGGIKEVYAEMLQECYGITLSCLSAEHPRSICSPCVDLLRSACHFRQKVQDSEQRFIEYIKTRSEVATAPEIKVEVDTTDLVNLLELEQNVVSKGRQQLKTKSEPHKRVTRSSCARKKQRVRKTKPSTVEADRSDDDSVPDEGWNDETVPSDKKTSELNENARLRLNIVMLLRNSTIVPFRYIKTSQNQYTCQYCDDNYFLFEDLRKHVQEKHSNVPEDDIKSSLKWPGEFAKAEISEIRCKHCKQQFQNLDTLTDHLVEVHKKMLYPLDMKPCYGIIGFILNTENPRCHICSEEFNCFRSLLTHMSTHSDTNVECDTCGKKFFNKKLLRGHVRSSHKNLEHKCKFCSETFKSMSIRRHHMKKKHDYGKHKCSECGESFNQFQQRLDHLVKVHNFKKRVYYCEICCKEYANSQGFTKHMQRTHWKDKQFICEKCGKHLASNEGLKAHLRVHSGEKPYKCKFCDKRFTTHNTLHLHVRGHLNDKRYICEVCGAGFIQKHCLKGHYKVHHPEIGYEVNNIQIKSTGINMN